MFRVHKEGDTEEDFVNLRPFAVGAAALATGAGFCYAALFCGVHFLYALLFLLPLGMILVFARRKRRAAVYVFLFLALFGVGMGGLALRMESYGAQQFREGEYALSGEISELTETEDGYARVLLTDVSADGRELDGNVTVYFYASLKNGEEGMRISFTGDLSPAGSALRYGVFRADMVLGNIKYTATCSASPVYEGAGGDLFTAVRTGIRGALYGSLPEEEAALAYALTTGYTDGIEEGLMESVRYGGVAHVFAVSGMHIGVFYGALAFLLKKMRAPKWLSVPLPLVAAFLFCGVCGFSSSAMRAFMTCAATAVCTLIGIRRDGIEAAGFACGVILLADPVYLLSLGFQLSAAAYIAIVALAPAAEKCFSPLSRRVPLLRKPLSAVAVMLAVQLCLLPVMLNAFGYVSVWGILLNLAALPLFTFYFPFLLAGVLLACLFPAAASVILFLPAAALSLFALFFRAADFSSLLVKGFSFGFAAAVAFYLLLLLWSGRVNARGQTASALACFLAAFVFVSGLLTNYVPPQTCRVVQMCYYGDYCCALVQTENADVLLVNGEVSSSRLQTFLFLHGAAPDAVVILSDTANAVAGSLLFTDFRVAYVPSDVTLSLRDRETVSADAFSVDGVDYVFRPSGQLFLSYAGVTGVFNGTAASADFSLFAAEPRDGLIFTIERGILSVS